MKTIVLLGAEGVQDEEFFYPYYRLQEEGWKVIVCSPNGELFKGKYGIPYKGEIIHPSDLISEGRGMDEGNFHLRETFDGLIIPGGWQCPELLRMNKYIVNIVKEMNDDWKIIGAICHGPQVLISAKVIAGHEVTGYGGIKDDVINAGGIWKQANVVKCENLVTAPHYRNNPEFVKTFIDMVNEQDN